ncbi:hypothetical protein FRC08_012730 [Ceratobasidium sp. 394]|nr:hypothetical protein FRC08_012730 [Ceratobasidium sp. 394]
MSTNLTNTAATARTLRPPPSSMPRRPKPATATTKKPRDTYSWPGDKTDWLISEASNPENIRTLLGKQEAGENTSGDTKAKVYGRIAAVIFAAEYSRDPKLWTRRVQHKWEYLGSQYRASAKRLRRTGEGLKRDPETKNADSTGSGIAEIELQYYIPPTGPDHDTPDVARNIWDAITLKFPQFPRMHELLSTRPNQVPIAVTTALTPSGPATVLHQPPSDSEGDEEDDDEPANSQSLSVSSLEPMLQASNSTGRTLARPSTQMQAAHRASKTGSGRRRLAIEDRFIEIQKQLQDRIFERDKHAQQLADRELILKEKRQLLEEFKLGLITPNEYRQAAARLGGGEPYSGGVPLPFGTSQSSQPDARSSATFSPEWENLGLSVGSELAPPSVV